MIARVRWMRPPEEQTARSHMLLRVEIDGESWIADVAFGAGTWLKDDDDTRLKVLFDGYARLTGEAS